MKKLSKSLASLSGSIYKIPNDVSVVSYGDSDWCRFYPTPITSMCQPVDEMGREAASILLERIKGKKGDSGVNNIDDNIVPNASHDLNSELSSDFEGTNRKMYTNVTL